MVSALLFLAAFAAGEVRVESIVVTGAYSVPEEWVVRRTFLREAYPDEAELMKALFRAEQLLLGTGHFLFVESFYLPVSEDENDLAVEIYISLSENLMPNVGSSTFTPTLFSDLPFYGWGSGFMVTDVEQGLSVFPLVGPPTSIGFFFGHRFLDGGSSFTARAFNRIDLWPFWAAELDITGVAPLGAAYRGIPVFALGSARVDIDYSALLRVWGIAPRIVFTTHFGYSDAWSLSFEEDLRIYIGITPVVRTALRVQFHTDVQSAQYGYSVQQFVGAAYRSAPAEVSLGSALVASADIRITKAFSIDLGFTDLAFGAFCFVDVLAGDAEGFRRVLPAAGVGASLSLGMPLGLTFLFGFSWEFVSETGKFLFKSDEWY